jgi:hypothetical protein
VSRYGLPFPRLSDDELEQFLIMEAVMIRWELDQEAAEADRQARHDAGEERERLRREAEERIAAYKAQRGG